jgi:hypothetical protein
MANLTLVVDDDVLRKARMRALEQGTSVNAVLRAYLEAYSGAAQLREAALQDLLELSRASRSRSGGSKWSREDLHER